MAYKKYTKKVGSFRKKTYGKKKMYKKYGGRRQFKSRSVVTNIVDTVLRRTTELKYFEVTNVIPFPLANVTYGNVLTFVPQGQNVSQRIGDRFRLKSLTLNVSMYEPATAVTSATSGFMRCIVFQWKPTVSAIPTIDQILDGLAEFDSPYNMSNRQMYKILLDKTVALQALTDNARHNFSQTLYFNGADANVQCQSGVVSGTNHVSIVFIPSHWGPSCSALSRFSSFLRYSDN